MPNNIVHTAPLKNYQSIVWEGQEMFKYYDRLKNHLRQNLGDEFALFFAEPHIYEDDLATGGEVFWSSEISDRLTCLPELPTATRSLAQEVLGAKLEVLWAYLERLRASDNPEDNRWGNLIALCLELPDARHVLFGHNQVVLVVWGFGYKDERLPRFDLSKKLPEWPSLGKTPVRATPAAAPQKQSAKKAQNDFGTSQNTGNNPQKKSGGKPPKKETGNEDTPRRKQWWWGGLLLLLGLTLGGLFRQCKTAPVRHLPRKNARIVPIDSGKVVNDPHNLKKIVADRLNIALTGDNKNLKLFAQKFKQAYPGKEYQVIYYDSLTYRLQLQVPAAKREKIKQELPQQLPEFKMLLWYEGIFSRDFKPGDPGFSHLKQHWYHRKIQAMEVWNTSKGDSSVVIAVVDNSFDLSHPEFRGKVYKPRNVPEPNNRVNTGGGQSHGTHVAGIALGLANNGQGVAGIAPNCKFMPVQVGNSYGIMSTTAVIDGILYAINNGAHIINVSLGALIPAKVKQMPLGKQQKIVRETYKDEAAFWNDLFKTAYDKNIVVVLAAGNDNVMIGLDPMQRSKYAIKVSATNPDDQKAAFSNYGTASTLSAPGVDIYSSLPGGRFGFKNGTSMAAPVVSGAIALVKSIHPALSYGQLVSLLQNTGKPVPPSGNHTVGNLVQVARALNIANRQQKRRPRVGCPKVQLKIDSLLQAIDHLKQECEQDEARGDTLRIPDGEGTSVGFAAGKWKSTTRLYNNTNGDDVTIYFEFKPDGSGHITLKEASGISCTASLSLDLRSRQLNINQLAEALCTRQGKTYSAYTFACMPDASGYAVCQAQNKTDAANSLTFRLIKIK